MEQSAAYNIINFSVNYAEFYKREHINLPDEIQAELAPYFEVRERSFFPLGVPLMFCNLCIGLALTPRDTPRL